MSKKQQIKIWGVVSAAVLGVSAIFPWVSALGTQVSLMEGDGPILLGTAAVAMVLIARGKVGRYRHSYAIRAYAAVAAAFGLFESIRIYVELKDAGPLAQPGFGLYLAGLAALSLAAWAYVNHVKRDQLAQAA